MIDSNGKWAIVSNNYNYVISIKNQNSSFQTENYNVHHVKVVTILGSWLHEACRQADHVSKGRHVSHVNRKSLCFFLSCSYLLLSMPGILLKTQTKKTKQNITTFNIKDLIDTSDFFWILRWI